MPRLFLVALLLLAACDAGGLLIAECNVDAGAGGACPCADDAGTCD